VNGALTSPQAPACYTDPHSNQGIAIVTIRTALAVALIAAALPMSAAEAKDGRNAAAAGGLAVGAVGGLLLGNALSNAQPQPVYQQPAPVYVEPQPTYVQPAPVRYVDPAWGRLDRLRMQCDDGSRNACIRFGMILGQNREREAQWRRARPDFYAWDNN
jgi:hypothetical protein